MDWVAFLAGLPAVLTALGDSLPGLLVAGAMIYLYREREKQIAAERADWLKCKAEAEADYKDMLGKVFSLMDTTNDALNSIVTNIAAQNRADRVGEKLDTLAKQIKAQEVKAGGNAKRGPGQARREIG